MKIVHIAPNAPYSEGWGYHENLLPKYHTILGHEVSLIVSNYSMKEGKPALVPCEDFMSADGFKVYRRSVFYGKTLKTLSKMEVYDILTDIKPDFVFFHGLVSSSIFDVVKYKKKVNPKCVIVQDNHLDYYNAPVKRDIKSKVLRFLYRMMFALTRKYISKVYCVTPWRKQYAEDYFKVPSNMTDILIMGADDGRIDFANRESIRKEIREKYGIKEEEFLIVSGGKIDKPKNIHLLVKAVNKCENVKLLVFGEVLEDIKEKFNNSLSDKIVYIGWIDGSKVYDYFFAGDLAIFPGTHSVLWEQACATKVPCVFKRWDGMDHVNNGGNSDFIGEVTVDALIEKIEELKFTPKYYKIKEIAQSEKTDIYLYSNIAERSLECIG